MHDSPTWSTRRQWGNVDVWSERRKWGAADVRPTRWQLCSANLREPSYINHRRDVGAPCDDAASTEAPIRDAYVVSEKLFYNIF